MSLLQFDGSLLQEAVASSSSAIVRMLLDAKVDVDARSKVLTASRTVYFIDSVREGNGSFDDLKYILNCFYLWRLLSAFTPVFTAF